MTSDAIVTLAQGRLQGSRQGRLAVFRGVPYAQARRFEPPRPVAAWDGVRRAIEPGPICPQHPARLEFLLGSPRARRAQSEDCQVLSVFSPDLTGRRPVMVWIHGGAYISGGGEEGWCDASRLAADGDVVVVTINYRLGALGYLYSAQPEAENLGLQDQIAALRWVRDNISRFGGDPDGMTVFGQSAGAHSIAAMLAMEGPQPFRRAILQSLPGPVITRQTAAAVCTQLRGLLEHPLESAPIEDLLKAQASIVARARGGLSFGPAGIDVMRPAPRGNAQPLDIMITWARDDAAPFLAMRREGRRFGGPLDRLVAGAVTRKFFAKPARALAARLRAAGHRVSTHEITWRPRGSRYGAAHCIELPLLLGAEADWSNAPMLGAEPPEITQRYGQEARSLWAAFARTGAAPGGTEWLEPRT